MLLGAAFAQGPENVLVVANQNSAISRTIADYYVLKRRIPLSNVCRIEASSEEEISYRDYERTIVDPVTAYLIKQNLTEKILYIVTTSGVPLRIAGAGEGLMTGIAAVDSELTLLYGKLHGRSYAVNGSVVNPFFNTGESRFSHPLFAMYLVTRLTGYDFADVKGLIDRALAAHNRGKFVIDIDKDANEQGNAWLRDAAAKLPKNRVLLDETNRVVLNQSDVIGYASWGSNDLNRKERNLGFHWLPGAIMTEFVSTNARTFRRPPDIWTIGNWKDQKTWFAGSPQTMTGDVIHEGVTGASGHVWEPYLTFTPRPDLLLPAYYRGRNLAESYYLAIPGLSWMNIVVGDPLCSLGKPKPE